MAIKETKGKKLSTGWKLAIAGFAILAAGLLAAVVPFMLGGLLLARDLLLTAMIFEGAYIGGVGGYQAVKGIWNAVENRKSKNQDRQKTLQRAQEEELERENEKEMGSLPSIEEKQEEFVFKPITRNNSAKQQTRK